MTSSAGTLRSAHRGSIASLDSARGGFEAKSPRVPRRSLDEIPEGPSMYILLLCLVSWKLYICHVCFNCYCPSAIPYTVKIATGDEKDMGTEASAWIRIIQTSKKHTGKLYLEQMSGRQGFLPSSIETFSLDALELKEVKEIEVSCDSSQGNNLVIGSKFC